MTRSKPRTRRFTYAITLVVTVAFVGAAIAAAPWTTEGSGKTAAKSGKLDPLGVTAATPTEELYPGQTAGAGLTITNPNKAAMVVTSIIGDGPIVSSSAACNAAGHGVTFANQTGSWSVAKESSLAVSLPNAVAMSLESANECQSATFEIPIKVLAAVTNAGQNPESTTTTTAPAGPASTTWVFANPSEDLGVAFIGGGAARDLSVTNNTGVTLNYVYQTVRQGAEDNFHASSPATNSCLSGPIAPGATCRITAVFHPRSFGTKTGVLELVSNSSAAGIARVELRGEGQTPPRFTYAGSGAFAQQAVGTTSSPQVFTITNQGQYTAPAPTVRIEGSNPGDFAVAENNCTGPLAWGASCTISVVFTPTATGQRSGALYAFSTTSAAYIYAGLNGTGV